MKGHLSFFLFIIYNRIPISRTSKGTKISSRNRELEKSELRKIVSKFQCSTEQSKYREMAFGSCYREVLKNRDFTVYFLGVTLVVFLSFLKGHKRARRSAPTNKN